MEEFKSNVTVLRNATEYQYDEYINVLTGTTDWYRGIHGYVSVTICTLGLILNILTVAVLTRKSMVTSVNMIITALTVSNMLKLTFYLLYAIQFCINETGFQSKSWIVFLLFKISLQVTTHTFGLFFTAVLTVVFLLDLLRKRNNATVPSLKDVKFILGFIMISNATAILLCIPRYIQYDIVEIYPGFYWFQTKPKMGKFHQFYNYWMNDVIFRLLLCFILVTISVVILIFRYKKATKNQQIMLIKLGENYENQYLGKEEAQYEIHFIITKIKQVREMAVVTVVIALSCVMVELPIGILVLLSGFQETLLIQVYLPLIEVFDLGVLVNSSMMFSVYVVLSSEFRKALRGIFKSNY